MFFPVKTWYASIHRGHHAPGFYAVISVAPLSRGSVRTHAQPIGTRPLLPPTYVHYALPPLPLLAPSLQLMIAD